MKTRFKTLALTAIMAALMPLTMNAQSDGFFRGGESESYENRDGGISINTGNANGIQNQDFNDTPLGSGLFILVAAGAGYTVARRKRNKAIKCINAIIIAFVMLLGLTQCKKKVDTISQDVVSNGTKITLNIDNGIKYEVNPPHVTFGNGDKIAVVYNGGYVGTLTHNGTRFEGEITIVQDGQKKLYFYFLSNASSAYWSVGMTQYNTSINYQAALPRVLSFGPSDQDFDSEVNTYTATLNNMCALAQFNLKKGTSNNVRISDMIIAAMIDFSSNTLTPSDYDIDNITLYSKSSTEKLAILFPSDSPQNTTISIDGRSYVVTIPALKANDWVKIDIENDYPNCAFSVGANEKVQFSPGNLQYKTGDGWRFAEHQYDIAPLSGGGWNTSSWVDLFGWGTWGDGKNPLNNSNTSASYTWSTDFSGIITNNSLSGWYTLSNSQWEYLFTGRMDCEQKYASATVNNVHGVVILPDTWILPEGKTFNAGHGSGWNTNVYSTEDWYAMETAGALFLPAAGCRNDGDYIDFSDCGVYWSRTQASSYDAYDLSFNSNVLNPCNNDGNSLFNQPIWYKEFGQSVRLVRPYTAK